MARRVMAKIDEVLQGAELTGFKVTVEYRGTCWTIKLFHPQSQALVVLKADTADALLVRLQSALPLAA